MRRILTIATMLVCGAAAANAAELDITPLERNLRFNFGNPGARALGMGGAFLGRADDASAAEANPAGLTIIAKREFTVEARSGKQSSTLPGTFELGTGQRFGFFREGAEYSSSSSYPAFASFAMPLGPVAVAAYYHRPLEFSSDQRLTTGSVIETVPGSSNRTLGYFPGTFSAEYSMTTIGVAGAMRFGPVSFGATARRQSLDAKSFGLLVGNASDLPATNSLPAANPASLRTLSTLNGSSSAMSYSAGFLWASATESVTVGGVYKKGAEFSDITTNLTSCTGAFTLTATSVSQTAASTCLGNFSFESPFRVPDVYGLGLSIRWPNGFTLNEDIVRVKSSQLLNNFHSSVFCTTFAAAGYTSGTSPNPFCTADAASLGFDIEDSTEVHIGAEYLIPNTAVALRAGVWVDPSPALQFIRGDSGGLTEGQRIASSGTFTCRLTSCRPVADVLETARTNATINVLGLGGRQIHTSVGLGYVARAFEIHAAYDRAQDSNTASVQFLTRF